MQNSRIKILDSFRGIAIVMVLFFHFFSRWTQLYPYSNDYNFFEYGKYGVHFFFMISGFVIFFTLDKTKSFKEFWLNRYIRLLPSMFFASFLTFFFLILFDVDILFPTSHYFKNILVSLTFIQPDLISSLTNYRFELDYISGSYWSLWVEIQFYFMASFIYFIYPKKFYLYFFLMASILVSANLMLSLCFSESWLIVKLKSLRSIFNLISALPFFCLGSVFYVFHKNKVSQIKNSFFLKISFTFFILFLVLNNWKDLRLLGLISSFILLFFLMIYYQKNISFLNNKLLNEIGFASYFLYLIHENLGVFLIHKNLLKLNDFYFIQPLLVIVSFIIISFLFTKYIERYVIQVLKKILNKHQ